MENFIDNLPYKINEKFEVKNMKNNIYSKTKSVEQILPLRNKQKTSPIIQNIGSFAITKTILRRLELLEKLKRNTYWLVSCNKPVNEKRAIWRKDFENFVVELSRQDKVLLNG